MKYEHVRLYIGDALQKRGEKFSFEITGKFTCSQIQNEAFPFSCHGTYCFLGRSLLLEGELRYTLTLTCDRCLKPFSREFATVSSDEFFSSNSKRAVFQSWEEGAEHFLYSGDVLLLDDWIRQLALLALPAKVLCSPDCKGLCHACGQNFNEGSCHCAPLQGKPVLI